MFETFFYILVLSLGVFWPIFILISPFGQIRVPLCLPFPMVPITFCNIVLLYAVIYHCKHLRVSALFQPIVSTPCQHIVSTTFRPIVSTSFQPIVSTTFQPIVSTYSLYLISSYSFHLISTYSFHLISINL